jgi:hypothetical protein
MEDGTPPPDAAPVETTPHAAPPATVLHGAAPPAPPGTTPTGVGLHAIPHGTTQPCVAPHDGAAPDAALPGVSAIKP